jgi:hypothetical protein
MIERLFMKTTEEIGTICLSPFLLEEAMSCDFSKIDVLTLPQALEGDASGYPANMKFIFKKISSYKYPTTCLDGQVVSYLQTHGTPPAQVKWSNGHAYWVEWADLRKLPPKVRLWRFLSI